MNRHHAKLAGRSLWLDFEMARIGARRGLWRALAARLSRALGAVRRLVAGAHG